MNFFHGIDFISSVFNFLFFKFVSLISQFISEKYSYKALAQEQLSIRHEPFAKMTFLKVDLKCFPLEKSFYRINYRFSWAVQMRCRKPHFEKIRFLCDFEICRNRSRNSIFCIFVKLLVLPIFKRFLIKLTPSNFECSFLTFPRTVFRETLIFFIFYANFLSF